MHERKTLDEHEFMETRVLFGRGAIQPSEDLFICCYFSVKLRPSYLLQS